MKRRAEIHYSVLTMLLWMPNSHPPVPKPPMSGGSVGMDEDEKAAKIQRAKKAKRYNNTLFLIASAILVIVVVTCFPSPMMDQPQIRGGAVQQLLQELPPNSIYRLSVPNATTGALQPLAPYAGHVTLVVNTACL